MKNFDVVVVGSGPSGATAAWNLANHGFSVAIVEKATLPRYKTCGGGVVGRVRELLPFDISSVVEKEFYRVDTYFDKTKAHFITERKVPVISMVMRAKFDHLLVQKAVEEGAVLFENTAIKDIEFGETIILKSKEDSFSAKAVIAADGALSTVARLANFKDDRKLIPAIEYEVEVSPEVYEKHSKEVRFDFDVVPNGYGWNFPKENHLSIGLGSMHRRKADFKAYYRDYMKHLGIDEVISEQFHGYQIPVGHRKTPFAQKGVFLVGDAAGFAEPIAAEGISNSIISGQLAAKSLINSDLNVSEAEKKYGELLGENILPELKSGRFLAKLFYEHATIRSMAVKKYGQKACEVMTSLFTGEKTFPTNLRAEVLKKLGLKL